MMNFTYENQNTVTYMVYKIEKDDVIDNTSLGMITNNKIPGIISIIYTQMNEDKYFKFNISSKTSLKDIFESGLNKQKVVKIFGGILDAFMIAEEYMLDPKNILLNLEYIFVNVSTYETELVCLPIYEEGKQNPDFSTFFKNLVFTAKFDQTENCDYIAKMINYLNSNVVFSVAGFKNVIQEFGSQCTTIETPQQVDRQQMPAQISAPMQQTSWSVEQPSNQVAVQSQNSQMNQQVSLKKEPERLNRESSQSQPNPIKLPKLELPVPPQKLGMPVPPQKPGMPVPPQKPGMPMPPKAGMVQSASAQDTSVEDEKKITMMYLLQHYNKENKEKYMEQKKKKKEIKNQAVPPQQENIPVPPQSGASSQTPSMHTSASTAPANTFNTPTSEPQMMNYQNSNENFGNTTVLNMSSLYKGTTVLSPSTLTEQPKPYLIRMKNNEKVMINKSTFRVGTERSFVDYFIGDNSAVSRNHASIITRDDTCYLIDVNSTNHTYLNGVMLNSNSEYVLEDGNKIRFANEEFEFRSGK